MALQTDKPYVLLPFPPNQDDIDTPPVIHLRLRPHTLQLAQRAGSFTVDVDYGASTSALIIDGAKHELIHSEEAPFTDLYQISTEHDHALSRVGLIRERLLERPADISAAGQRLKERREQEEAKRAEHRTVLLDAPAQLKRALGGAVTGTSNSSNAISRSSSLGALSRTARQLSETPSSSRGSPIARAHSRPNLISAESIRAASPAPPSVASAASPTKDAFTDSGRASTPTLGAQSSATPYSSPRFSLRTRLVQFLALGPKPRRQTVAALAAPEPQVLALLAKIADRPSELQPDVSASSSPALGANAAIGSPQSGGASAAGRFNGPVNRRVTNVAPPQRPQGHLSPSTVYMLKDSVYLGEVNIASWSAYTAAERKTVSKYAHEAFKRLGVTADNDPAGWSKLYPDGWPTEAELQREREREELDRDPNFAMRDDEVLSEIDPDELEREFGALAAQSASHSYRDENPRQSRYEDGSRPRGKRRRDHDSGSRSDSVESSSDLSDVPDTLAPLPRGISGRRTTPTLSSSSSNSSLGHVIASTNGLSSQHAPSKSLATSASMPSMASAAAGGDGEKPPPKKKGMSTLERIARAAKGKGPSTSEREKQIQKARKQAAKAAASATAEGSTSKAASGAVEGKAKAATSSGETSKSSKRTSHHASQNSLPSMDFSMLHDIGRLRQEGADSQELRRSQSMNHFERERKSHSSLAGSSLSGSRLNAASVSPSVPSSSKLSARERERLASSKASSSKSKGPTPGPGSPKAGGSKKLKKQPERRHIEFTDSEGETEGHESMTTGPKKKSASGSGTTKKKKNAASGSQDYGGHSSAGGRAAEGLLHQRWQSLRDERSGDVVMSSGDESQSPSKKGHSQRQDVLRGREGGSANAVHLERIRSSSAVPKERLLRRDTSMTPPPPPSSSSSSRQILKRGMSADARGAIGAAPSRSEAGSHHSRAEREQPTLPGSMVRSHRGVGKGANISAEPWLELRSVGDWHLLAKRFLRQYDQYRQGRETVDRERERLLAEMEAAEREMVWEQREQQRQTEERERAAAATAASPSAGTVANTAPKTAEPAANGERGGVARAESPEEGEMTPEHEQKPLQPPPAPSSALAQQQLNSTSARRIDMGASRSVSRSRAETSGPPTSAAGPDGAHDVRNGDADDEGNSGPLTWRPTRIAAEPEAPRGRPGPGLGPGFTPLNVNGIRNLAHPPPSSSAASATASVLANTNVVVTTTSRLGTQAPMPLEELEELVQRCKVWQGELYRMKRALVRFKQEIELQEGRASESEAEADAEGEGEPDGDGQRSRDVEMESADRAVRSGSHSDRTSRDRSGAVMGLGFEASVAGSAFVDGDGDVRME